VIEYPGTIADGLHTFRVRGVGEGGPDPSPAAYTWLVDTVPPDTVIDSGPPDPSSGFSASFTYHSTETQPTFRCQLDSGAIQVCSGTGKTYFGLVDGVHTFRVWSSDNAGNKDASAAERSFTVQTVLGDLSPPDTSIRVTPPNPSPSSDANFQYASSEKDSRFECRLGGAFASCAPSGTAYRDLKNGTYTFEVRAIDAAGNVDSLPAAYTWRVAAPLPSTRIVKGPPGRVSVGRGKKPKLVFRYAADKPGSTFRCRLDKKPFKECEGVKRIVATPGRHVFEVYAIDSLGNIETTPAKRIVRVVKRGGGGVF
jgi:hypothetical protein